jgi:Fe-S-cluster containining protein
MYKIIKLRQYDVSLPFICHQCGKCCRRFTPPIDLHRVPAIAEFVNKPEQEIKALHEAALLSRNDPSQNIDDCPFLDEDGKCSIYPLRPECCRLYPLFTGLGAADVDCSGYKEFKEMVGILFKHRIDARPHYRRYNRRKIRPITTDDVPRILRRLMSVNSSTEFINRFLEINNIKVRNEKL